MDGSVSKSRIDDYDDNDTAGISEGDIADSNTLNFSSSLSLSESTSLAMTVPELKEKLREEGLPLSGK